MMQHIISWLEKFWNGDWGPWEIFHETTSEYHSYDEPVNNGIFGTDYGYSSVSYSYTELGEWFERMPAIVQLLKLPYYVVVWPLFLFVNLIRIIFELFYKPWGRM